MITMVNACKGIQLVVRSGSHPTSTAKILRAVSERGAVVLTHCTYFDGLQFKVLLVTEATIAAKHALEDAGYDCSAEPIVMVRAPDQVGAAAQLGRHLSNAGIDILYSYASVPSASEFLAVFNTSDNERAMQVLQRARLSHAA